MWMLSQKVSEDIFRKQLERMVGAVANHLQQGLASGCPLAWRPNPASNPAALSVHAFFILLLCPVSLCFNDVFASATVTQTFTCT